MGGADVSQSLLAVIVVTECIAASERARHHVAIQGTSGHVAGAVFEKSEIPCCTADEVARVVSDGHVRSRGLAGFRNQGASCNIGLPGVDAVLNALAYV